MATEDAVKLVMSRAAAVGRAMKEMDEAPAGFLYAELQGQLSLEEFDLTVDVLMRSGLVTRHNHVLRWHEPKGD